MLVETLILNNYLLLLLVTMKKRDKVVKIDSGLLAEVEAFIKLEENRFRYVNRKQFVDVAVTDFLKRCKK